jgi:hypothetical protein
MVTSNMHSWMRMSVHQYVLQSFEQYTIDVCAEHSSGYEKRKQLVIEMGKNHLTLKQVDGTANDIRVSYSYSIQTI